MTHLPSLVGQSLMFRFVGPEFTPADRDALNQMRPGGVLLFGDNLTSRDQVRALTAQLQDAAREEGLPPLFIAADQEGGIVTRIPADLVTVPSAMALGPLDDDAIRTSACINARQLRSLGINLNYAPTLDVNNNPENPVIRTRSFGEKPEQVARAGVATIEGHLAEGVIPTAKHFPGHGNTSVDSHFGLPVIDASVEELNAVELMPYKAAIAAGLPSIMTAHIRFPALDNEPATLSHRILTGLLREELGFTGVIHTDSMSMHAIANRYGIANAAIRAKAAGIDVLESSEPPAPMLERHAALIAAIESGDLDEAIFQATADRLNALRARFPIGEPLPDPLDTPALFAEAQSIADRTIRTPDGSAIPTIPDEPGTVIIAFDRLRDLEVVDRYSLASEFASVFARTIPQATIITLPNDPDEQRLAAAEAAANHATTLVIATKDAIQHHEQREIARQLIAGSPQAHHIHVCLRGPYDANLIGDVNATVLTFGDAVVSLRALANAMAPSSHA